MADESIKKYMRPGFPKENIGAHGYYAEIEYIGPYDELKQAPNVGEEWGDYIGYVTAASIEPIDQTTYGIMTVVVEQKFGEEDYPESREGVLKDVNYEVDWVDVQRSLYEHPEFKQGGTYELTNRDVADLKKWETEPWPEYKSTYFYHVDPSDSSSTLVELSENAKVLAKGIELGIEYWVDKAPVARRQETYVNGPPPRTSAGQKEDPPAGFPNLPDDYEWIVSADRSIMRGDANKWNRDTEWIGAVKVLLDKSTLYYADSSNADT